MVVRGWRTQETKIDISYPAIKTCLNLWDISYVVNEGSEILAELGRSGKQITVWEGPSSLEIKQSVSYGITPINNR